MESGAENGSSNNDAATPPAVANVTNEVAALKVEETTPEKSAPASPSAPGAAGTFISSFKAFSKFGDPKSDGKHITLSQSDKWMKQAKVIDGKKITTTDTGIYFKKHKSNKLGVEQYKTFLEELAKNKKVELADIKSKMANCGPPGFTGGTTARSANKNVRGGSSNSTLCNRGITRATEMSIASREKKAGKAASAVDRLTDVTKYTGSHKQRFDETGKGKGIAGRKDLPDQSGYVQGYQNKDSYKAQ